MENERVHAVTWDAPEHKHVEKSGDWFWAVGIIAVAGGIAAIVLGNTLFGIVLFLGCATVIVFGMREPKVVPFSVSTRGIRMGERLYPYSTLESYYINDEAEPPQLLVRSQQLILPILVLPIPEEYRDDIASILMEKLPEEMLEEPFSEKLLEFFGF